MNKGKKDIISGKQWINCFTAHPCRNAKPKKDATVPILEMGHITEDDLICSERLIHKERLHSLFPWVLVLTRCNHRITTRSVTYELAWLSCCDVLRECDWWISCRMQFGSLLQFKSMWIGDEESWVNARDHRRYRRIDHPLLTSVVIVFAPEIVSRWCVLFFPFPCCMRGNGLPYREQC